MVNKLILIGFLTKDPETRYLPDGKAVVNFTIASNYRYGDKKETLFMDCVVFGKSAEFVGKYFVKGTLAYVDGRLTERTWEDNLGTKHKKMQLIINDVKSLTKREGNGTATDVATYPNTDTTVTNVDSQLEPF